MIKLALLLFATLKLGKIALTGGTLLLSLAIYAQIFGWPYAAGFLTLLLLHELGHYFAARQRGLAVGAPTFIPFVGAYINLRAQPRDAETEAYVAFAGPFVGTLASFACYFWGRHIESPLWLAISYSGFFLNLFNLIPVSPLDGGRITAVLSPRIWLLGAPFLLAMLLYRPSPALVMIVILAIPQLLAAWRFNPKAPANVAYYNAPAATKVEYAVMYFGLAAVLAIMTAAVHDLISATSEG